MEDSARRCRICLKYEGSKESAKMNSIFEKNNIAEDIFLCTQIRIIEENNVPALICVDCLNDLEVASRFRLNAVKADKFFQEFAKKYYSVSRKSLIKAEYEGNNSSNIKTEPVDYNYDILHNVEMIVDMNDCFENVDVDSFQESEKQSTYQEKNARKNKKVKQDNLNESRVICSYCNKSFKNTYIKKHHSRAHSNLLRNGQTNQDSSPLFCKICKHQYTSQTSLRKHMKVKHEFIDEKYRFVCDHCGRSFVVKDYILRHMKVRHMKSYQKKKINEDNNQGLPCDQCGKFIKNRGLLKSHMRSHIVMTADEYFYCDLCPRKFKTKGGCSWHIHQRHVLKATYKCPFKDCTSIYKGKWELKMHMKSRHTQIRDYFCEICGKGFCDKQKLQIHTRIHTNERLHACTICTATFIHQTDLRRHIWGHTGYRPYPCTVTNCGRGFMKKSELLNHTNRCHSTLSSTNNTNTHYTM